METGVDSIFKEVKMEYTGERFIPSDSLMNDETAFEHLHRYHSVSGLIKGKVVLDIASGEGYGSAILAASASKIFGIDIDPEVVRYAREKYSAINNVEFLTGQAENIPLPDHSIDVVVSFETIEHLDQPTQEKFLQEIKRVLKNDGSLIISTPDKTNYSDRYGFTNKYHLKEFTSEEFLSFLTNYFGHVIPYIQGYEVVSAITETDPKNVNSLRITDWERSTHPFSRKYLINICSDEAFSENPEFSSIVLQVNKDFMQMTDRIVAMEAHILELGTWGRRLNKEIEEKNILFSQKIKELEEARGENEKRSISLQKITAELENKTKLVESFGLGFQETAAKSLEMQKRLFEEVELNRKFHNELLQSSLLLDEKTRELDKLSKAIKIIAEEKEKLEKQLEQDKDLIKNLEAEKADHSKIVSEQRTQVGNLHSQLNSVNNRLAEIYGSDGWKLLNQYYKLKGKLLPENSGRYKALKKFINTLRGKKDNAATSDGDLPINEEPITYHIIEFPQFEFPSVSIIIPAYNGWRLTYKCLASIKENTLGVSYEVIIGDDASTDETKNISDYIKNITVIRNETNLEFLHNCNHAATYAKGKYILFLNNDTEVKPGWLSSMVELMEKDESIGMVGSKLIYPNGKLQEAGAIIWKDASGWNFGLNQDPNAPEFNYVKEVDYISGASIILRTELWKEIGGFDNRYTPAYCEDSDLAFEVRKHGYKVIYQPLSEVVHFEGYTHGTDKNEGIKGSEIKAYQKLNNEKFKEKWKEVLLEEHFPNGENVFWARDRSGNRKTILVIDHYVPHFDKDAGSKTVFQYLKLFVSLNINVKFIGDNFYRHEPYTTVLQQLGIEVLYGPHYTINWKQWILDNHDKFDYVLLNRPHISIKYIDFIKEHTQAKVLYYGHDLHFVRLAKQHKIENKTELLDEAEKWKQTEIYIFNKADIILTPSEDERNFITGLGISENKIVAIKPYFFETQPEPITDFSGRKDILFVGGFTHMPNVDAVLWFANEIWPLLKNKVGGAKFIIAGSNAPMEIRALAGNDIEVLGFISDEALRNLYGKIKMVIIPLRYGAGVKGKTVEAMYNGIPLVTTDFGVEGLPGDASFLTPQNNPVAFAQEVVRLYNASNNELTALSAKEAKYIHDHFHFDIVKSELQAILNMHEETIDLTLTNQIH